jgi:hypothetical protein
VSGLGGSALRHDNGTAQTKGEQMKTATDKKQARFYVTPKGIVVERSQKGYRMLRELLKRKAGK